MIYVILKVQWGLWDTAVHVCKRIVVEFVLELKRMNGKQKILKRQGKWKRACWSMRRANFSGVRKQDGKIGCFYLWWYEHTEKIVCVKYYFTVVECWDRDRTSERYSTLYENRNSGQKDKKKQTLFFLYIYFAIEFHTNWIWRGVFKWRRILIDIFGLARKLWRKNEVSRTVWGSIHTYSHIEVLLYMVCIAIQCEVLMKAMKWRTVKFTGIYSNGGDDQRWGFEQKLGVEFFFFFSGAQQWTENEVLRMCNL